MPCPDLSLISRGGPVEAPLGLSPCGGRRRPRKPRRSLPLLDPSSGETRGEAEKGQGLSCRGSDASPAPACHVTPQAPFQVPDESSSFPFLASSSAFHSTPWVSPAQHSPGPEEAGGVRLRPPPRSWGGAETQAGRTPQTGGDPGDLSPGHSPSWPPPSARARSTVIYRELLMCGLLGFP